mmetsp:Transcript_33634/g.44413  ORF Transcript_33634/g.44413 Transcript_33634/m.44413 type:complete len:84 (-) Transcript_33634:69-320(-)
MPAQVKFTLIFMAIFFAFMIVFYKVDFGDLSDMIIEEVSLQMILWACIHWQFTYFYLNTALLFRTTFTTSSDSDFEKVKKRKK